MPHYPNEMLKQSVLNFLQILTQLVIADVLFFTWVDNKEKNGMNRLNENSLQKERHINMYFFLVIAITIFHHQKETESI